MGMRLNSDSIYATRPLPPHALNITHGKATHEFAMVHGPSANIVYVSLMHPDGGLETLPETLHLPFVLDLPGGAEGSWPMGPLEGVTLLAETPEEVDFAWQKGYLTLKSLSAPLRQQYVSVFRLQYGVEVASMV